MSSINRILPDSYDTRLMALNLAVNKRDTLAPGTNPLSAATDTRLTNMGNDFNAKMAAIANAKSAYNNNTPLKENNGRNLRMLVSHFFQVFNLGVGRGKYAEGDRAFYNLPVDSNALPELVKDSDLILWSTRAVDGDSERITAGGAAMANPDAVEVDTARNTYIATFNTQSTLKDALDIKQEALEAIIPEADKVIKKVWDELDTFYNEETDESRRNNLREWGVVYSSVGGQKNMSGTVTYNGLPNPKLIVRFKNGKNKVFCNTEGAYSISTTLVGEQDVIIEKQNEDDVITHSWTFIVTLSENDDLNRDFAVTD